MSELMKLVSFSRLEWNSALKGHKETRGQYRKEKAKRVEEKE